MIGPSGEARRAASQAVYKTDPLGTEAAVTAAYPIIRRDVIAEVVKAVRQTDEFYGAYVADFIEREFGGDDA
jgi:hypothetical protein